MLHLVNKNMVPVCEASDQVAFTLYCTDAEIRECSWKGLFLVSQLLM